MPTCLDRWIFYEAVARCLVGPKAFTSAVTFLATSTNLPASEEETQEN